LDKSQLAQLIYGFGYHGLLTLCMGSP